MALSEGTALLLRVLDAATGALGPLPPSTHSLRIEREVDSLRATVESWRDVPPDVEARRVITQRVLRLHKEATTLAHTDIQSTAGARGEPKAEATTRPPPPHLTHPPPDAERESERPTVPPGFDLASFARRMTAPEAEPITKRRPSIEVELDEAFSVWHDAEPPAGPPSSIESAVIGAVEDSGAPVISRREIEDPAAYVLERYQGGDFEGALDIAEIVLSETPGDLLVRECREMARDALAAQYAEKLGGLQRVPVAYADGDEGTSMDHRAAFLLSLVDGQAKLETIVQTSGMPVYDALRIIRDLVNKRMIGFG